MKNSIFLKSNKESLVRIDKIFLFGAAFLSLNAFSQQKVKDSTQVESLDEVLVSAVRVTSKTPVSFSKHGKKEIRYRNLGQDIPDLKNYLPSV